MKVVVSLDTGEPELIVMGAPIVLVELGTCGITGSLGASTREAEPHADQEGATR